MDGDERYEVGKVRWEIDVLLWKGVEEVVLQVRWHKNWDGDLLFLYCGEIGSAYLAADSTSRIITIYGRGQHFKFTNVRRSRNLHPLLLKPIPSFSHIATLTLSQR